MFKDQDSDFDKIDLTILESVTVNRNPTSDKELSDIVYVDDSLGEKTNLRPYQRLQQFVKPTAGNTVYSVEKSDKQQITETTVPNVVNSSGNLLQQRNIKCKDEIIIGSKNKIHSPTKINTPTGNTRTSSSQPDGDSFVYKEFSSKNVGPAFLGSLMDKVQIRNITFYYTRYSNPTKSLAACM